MAHGPTGHLFSGLFNDPKAALFHGWGRVGQKLLAPSILTLEPDPGNVPSLLLRGWSTRPVQPGTQPECLAWPSEDLG